MRLRGKMNVLGAERGRKEKKGKQGSLTRRDRKEEEKNLLFVSSIKACA